MKTSSPEFKQMQRKRIYKTKPWLKSTGPNTTDGKEKSKLNALKVSPELHSLMKEYKQLMHQKRVLCFYIT